MGARSKKKDHPNSSFALLQTKGAVRLLRAYGDIGSRATKYALVVLAEALGTQGPNPVAAQQLTDHKPREPLDDLCVAAFGAQSERIRPDAAFQRRPGGR